MKNLREIVEKAHGIETQAAYDYTFGLSRLQALGYSYKELQDSLKTIAVETIIHKHLMEGLLNAVKELEKMDQTIASLEEREGIKPEGVSPQTKALVKRFAERHLEIERDMVETYAKLAEEADHPVIRELARQLEENEKQHHQRFMEMISKL
ncbi:MAG: hypothetical protein F7B60_01885 [Desulfurococcales archaeon]|nr:hypothetical protein [Desulfurococcales archaeon]